MAMTKQGQKRQWQDDYVSNELRCHYFSNGDSQDELFLIPPGGVSSTNKVICIDDDDDETIDVDEIDSCQCGNSNARDFSVSEENNVPTVSCDCCNKKYRYRKRGTGPSGQLTAIKDVSLLKPGDHIVLKRTLYTHHAIVTAKIANSRTEVMVCHFDGPDHRLKGAIVEEPLQVIGKAALFRVDYNAADRWPAPVVVAMARHHIGDKNYHLLFDNCEHRSNFWVTGFHHSSQVDAAKTVVAHTGHRLLLELGEHVTRKAISAAIDSDTNRFDMFRRIKPIGKAAYTGLMIGFELWDIVRDVRQTEECRSQGIVGGEIGVPGGRYDVPVRKICRNVGSFVGSACGSLVPLPIIPKVGLTLVGSFIGERVVGPLASGIVNLLNSDAPKPKDTSLLM